MSASSGVKELGLSRRTNKLLLSRPLRLNIQAVTVVPMLAPMITLMAWVSVISPELTKPTTMTVVAEDDWMMAVTPRPVSRPTHLPVVSLPSSALRLPPARFSNASPIRFMPNRNRDRPPIRVSTLNRSMVIPPNHRPHSSGRCCCRSRRETSPDSLQSR